MRVIFVNRYFAPDESATSRMVSSLAFGLAEHGYSVVALTGRRGRDSDGACLPRREKRGGVRIHRLPTIRATEAGLAGRVADQAAFQLAVAVWCLGHLKRDDIVVACTDPPMISVTLALIAAARGARLVNWLHDIYPEIAIELGVLPRGSATARLTLTLRDWSLRRAALNIVPTTSMADGLRRRGMSGERLMMMPYWSEDEIDPVPPTKNALRAEWDFGDAFVVGYSGNFGRAHEFDTLLDAATLLLDKPGMRFLLIGGGYGRDHIETEVRRRELTNVSLRPLQPRARLSESLSAADLHLISLRPALEPYVLPSKLYGIMAAGRPAIFIGAANGEVATALRRDGCGETVAIGAGAELAARIVALRDDPRRLATMGTGARQAFEARHRREDAINAWIALVDALAGGEGAEARYSAASGDAMKG